MEKNLTVHGWKKNDSTYASIITPIENPKCQRSAKLLDSVARFKQVSLEPLLEYGASIRIVFIETACIRASSF